MSRIVKDLRDKKTKKLIYPITHVDAVVDSDGSKLSSVISDLKSKAEKTGYVKPQGGIPSTDMSQSVQQSLSNADANTETLSGLGLVVQNGKLCVCYNNESNVENN